MKTIICLLIMFAFAAVAIAQQPVNVNFNLVQVNHYHNGQDSINNGTAPVGQRYTVDLGNPVATALFTAGNPSINISPAAIQVVNIPPQGTHSQGKTLNWESSLVLCSPAGDDSFLVTASRIGCPGTEVRPSVSVAFATNKGWSDPPIRFGPLAENTICPLGKGFMLEVSAVADNPPKVSLDSDITLIGKR